MIATPTFNAAEGERRKLSAMAMLEARREVYILRGRRALLAKVLDTDTATADDVRAAVELPDGLNPNCFGAVPGLLARAGIIGLETLRLSARPARHAGINRVWILRDRVAAMAWLADHPDRPDPTPPYSSDSLFGFITTTHKKPGVIAPGIHEKRH